jgi:hypothetical protein
MFPTESIKGIISPLGNHIRFALPVRLLISGGNPYSALSWLKFRLFQPNPAAASGFPFDSASARHQVQIA